MRGRHPVFVSLLLLFACRAYAVIPVSADAVIQRGHYFDLEGRTLHFKPLGIGYSVSSSLSSQVKPAPLPGELLGKPDYPFVRSWGYRRSLPFPFRFGGKVWREIFVNSAGNLTFGRPEAELYPERDTWPDGTMQSVGGAINDRAAAGQELMICALWGLNAPEEEKTQIYVRQNASEFVVTWKTQRYQWFGEGYAPLGQNVFQARLSPDGAIAFSYQKVSEKDGIVGVFPSGYSGRQIATLHGGFVTASLAGGTLRFSFAREQSSKVQRYRVVLAEGANTCEIGIDLRDSPKPWLGGQCTGNPGYRVDDHHVELFATTFELENILKPGVRWASWPSAPGDDPMQDGHVETVPFPLSAPVPPARLATMAGYRQGNIFEVFHYPHVSKHPYPLLHSIYEHASQRAPAQDDFAAIFTDFRIDDLHNHQGTRTPYGYGVKGVGAELTQAEDTFPVTGSHKLQAVTGPVFLGPRFAEFLDDGDRHFQNYANAVGWLAHEFGHRWGLALQFRNPATGKIENLADADGHWSDYLNTPAMMSVWKMFCDQPYVEKSQMEGFVYSEGPSGVFSRQIPSWNIASGFSALDLYVMGLIGPDEVPDTFLIANPQLRNEQEVSGEKVPVRIQDIIAASGVREPGVRESQKDFTVGVYLLHEGNREPYADKLRQAEGIEKSLIEYYRVATGGRMRLIPAQASQ